MINKPRLVLAAILFISTASAYYFITNTEPGKMAPGEQEKHAWAEVDKFYSEVVTRPADHPNEIVECVNYVTQNKDELTQRRINKRRSLEKHPEVDHVEPIYEQLRKDGADGPTMYKMYAFKNALGESYHALKFTRYSRAEQSKRNGEFGEYFRKHIRCPALKNLGDKYTLVYDG